MPKKANDDESSANHGRNCVFVKASEIVKGDVILHTSGSIAKVFGLTHVKVGKHGPAKVILRCRDVFTEKKHIWQFPGKARAKKCNTELKSYDVSGIDDEGWVHILTEDGDEVREFVQSDGEWEEKIRAYVNDDGCEMKVLEVAGRIVIQEVKKYDDFFEM